MKNTTRHSLVLSAFSALMLSALLTGTACKSKPVAEDPHAKIDKAHQEHMDHNKEEYKKDPQ
ncbi:hypothetical protein GC167_01420 [bacterium]|nr:hypothetical protein [bacterium]